MVLMLYRIRNGLIAIPAAAYLEPVHIIIIIIIKQRD